MTTAPQEPTGATSATVDALSKHVKAAAGDRDFVASCAAEAEQLVARHLGVLVEVVPAAILLRAVVEVGADLFYRRATKNGIAAFGDGVEVPPVRIRRDPLDAARPLLDKWTGGPFA